MGSINDLLKTVKKLGPVGALTVIALVLVYHLVWGSDSGQKTLETLNRHVRRQEQTMYVSKQTCYFIAQLAKADPAKCDPPSIEGNGN